MHTSPLLEVDIPDVDDSADVPTHLETIVTQMEPHSICWCLSSDRPAVTPTDVGMTIYETDTKKLMVYYGATIGWKPPWSTAWGTLGVAEADAVDITTVGQILSSSYVNYNSVNVTVVVGRLIVVHLTVASLASIGSPGSAGIRITAGGTRMRGTPIGATTPNFVGPAVHARGYEVCPSTGTRQYAWSGRLLAGSAVNIAAPVLLTVHDAGPA